MAELLILWGYIGIVNSCIGAGVLKGIGLLTGRKKIVYGLHTADRERQRRRKKRAAADLAV